MTTQRSFSQITRLRIRKMVFSAMFLAMGLLLPFLTGQVPQIGGMLCPMHLPILLCGFICGPFWGGAVGLVCPLLRHMIFSMPPLFSAIAMTFELCTYGVLAGIFYKLFSKMNSPLVSLYISLLCAMLGGRLIWGAASYILILTGQTTFSFQAFWLGGFVQAWPGIVIQLILIPPLVAVLKKLRLAE